jgi:hypothetical protein
VLRRSVLRAKPKYKPVALERHHDRVANMPCLVCGAYPPNTVHHVTGYADRPGRISRDHFLVVPLCAAHHLIQCGPKQSVEALGHQGFFQEWGIDLFQEAMRLAEETQREAA